MRYELTDHEWTAIRPMLPNKPRGVPRVNDRRVLNGIFWVLRSGAPWRDNASVQMIVTSIVRVHQHGACVIRNRKQSMGRSRGGLTSKIHAVVDTNGLPVRLALTAGEAHDNRLAGRLLSRLKSGTGTTVRKLRGGLAIGLESHFSTARQRNDKKHLVFRRMHSHRDIVRT